MRGENVLLCQTVCSHRFLVSAVELCIQKMTFCTHIGPLQKALTDQTNKKKIEEVAFELPSQIADLLNTDVVARQFTGKPSRVSEFQQFCEFAKIPSESRSAPRCRFTSAGIVCL